jgi:hypothetical protein
MPMADQSEKLKLDENHRRAVSVVLQSLERMCDDCEAWLARSSGLLLRVQNDLSERQRESLRNHLQQVRDELRRISHEMAVDVKIQFPQRAILALLVSNVTNLEETNSKQLRGYGRLSEEAAVKVDAEMARLNAILEQMINAIERG